MNKTAVVTGGGSGVGRAIALKLAAQGWRVVVLGRRAEPLKETIQLAGANSAALTSYPCDIGDAASVAEMGRDVLSKNREVHLLVNAAGTNAPRRALEVLSLDDYHAMIATNLNGAYYCVQAFLPQMRARKSGLIVNIVSDAAKQASAKAGPAYVMSKFGLVGLTQSINAEERPNGIRACAILPGDIDTPLLDKRPAPPEAAARAKMLRAEDVADCALFCINLPEHVVVEEMLVRPR
ncbi:MAG TPA: SDR family oxidoreductase [Verrucomicrobiae bacterium]|nr:SDR family oxidoreductase [Verrucomicrobiae bacterium]